MKKKLYLAGRIFHKEKDKDRDYRSKFVSAINNSILDGMIEFVYPVDYNVLTCVKDNGGSFSSSIVNMDLKLIYNSDILFAYFNEDLLDKYSYPFIGSSMEIMFAHQHNKYIFTVVNKFSSEELRKHPFLRHFSDILIEDDITFGKTIDILGDFLL